MTSMAVIGGTSLLHDALANLGTAFSASDRERLGLRGLLPARVESLEEQVWRVLENVRRKPTPIEQYDYMRSVQDENETLFFRVLLDHLPELLPIVYTPIVGQACQEWSLRYLRARGLYLTPEDSGQILDRLRSVAHPDVAIIVITDGGRILGLGDLGSNGMGIPIGKLALYTACAAIAPQRCLPVMLDVGTDTAAVRDDPCYLGLRMPRLTGSRYDALLDEFVAAAQQALPAAIVQFEDFGNANAFRLLARHRDRACAFNDDVQGTGAMGLAGIFASGSPFSPVNVNGRTLIPGQANNAYVFPAVGLGVLVSGARRASDEMFVAAAVALADSVTEHDLASGRVFPPQGRMREVAASAATAVANVAYDQELATKPPPPDISRAVLGAMYRPAYA